LKSGGGSERGKRTVDRPEFVGTIGEKLQEARRRKGKSLKEIENILRIRASYLEALEKDNFEKIPGFAYAKAFLKSYANYLGLDAESLVSELEKVYKKEPLPSFPQRREIVSMPRNKRWIWLAISIAFLVLALIIFQPFSSKKPPPTKEKLTIEKEIQQTPALETTPTEEATESAVEIEEATEAISTTYTPVVGEKLKLSVNTVGTECWLRIITDGERAFEGILVEGESREWEATETITVRVGSPKAVELEINGEPIEIPSGVGVFEKTFRREG
jgi:cytoskeletal protein RodZ